MQGDFWDKLKDKKFSDIYHPDGKWIIVNALWHSKRK